MVIAHLQVCHNSHCQLCNKAKAFHAVALIIVCNR